jgi:hypothetical protein
LDRKIRSVEKKLVNGKSNERHSKNVFGESGEKATLNFGKNEKSNKIDLISSRFREIFEKNKNSVGTLKATFGKGCQNKNQKVIASIDIFSKKSKTPEEKVGAGEKIVESIGVAQRPGNFSIIDRNLARASVGARSNSASSLISSIGPRKYWNNDTGSGIANNDSLNLTRRDNGGRTIEGGRGEGKTFPLGDSVCKIKNYLEGSTGSDLNKLGKKTVGELLEIKNLINKRLAYSPWFKIIV